MRHIKKFWFNQIVETESQLDFLYDLLDMMTRDSGRKKPKTFRIIVEELDEERSED